MSEQVEPIPFLIALALIVAWWLALGVRDRRRARRAEVAERVRLIRAARVRAPGMCTRLVRTQEGEWVVCSRPHEHTGPHFNQWTGDLER